MEVYQMINWQDIEDLGFEAELLTNMALTIEDAMSYGPGTAAEYLRTLSLLRTLLLQHADKLNVLVKAELTVQKENYGG
jgi:hypothetical protein